MTVEDKLKALISTKYKSFREFSISVGIPYSTLDSIFKRGISNAGISNVIAICEELNIDTEELCKGNIVEKGSIVADHVNLQPEILKDKGIQLYLKLDAEDKAEIRGEMKHMLRQLKYNNHNLSYTGYSKNIVKTVAKGGDFKSHTITDEESLRAAKALNSIKKKQAEQKK